MKRIFDNSLKMRLSQLPQTTESAHSAGLRWLLLLGLGGLLLVGVQEARGFTHRDIRIFAYLFYAFLAGIVLWVWFERVTIDSSGICVLGIFGRNRIHWDEIEVIEYPWKVTGKYEWVYREYARIQLRTGKVRNVAIAGARASRVLREAME